MLAGPLQDAEKWLRRTGSTAICEKRLPAYASIPSYLRHQVYLLMALEFAAVQ